MSIPHRLLQVMRLHQRSFWRNPESAFFNFAMPLAVLLIYGATLTNNTIPGQHHIKVLTLFAPGICAFAIVVVAYGNLAATIASQRAEGVLKRLRATPMQPTLYIAGELLSILVITLLVAAATIGLGAAAFDAVPRTDAIPELLLLVGLGTACFAALGLAISTVIRSADAALPITNGTYLPLAMVSGMFSATLHLPPGVATAVSLLPLKPLTDSLRGTYNPASHGIQTANLAVLAAWTIAGVIIAKRNFKWEP